MDRPQVRRRLLRVRVVRAALDDAVLQERPPDQLLRLEWENVLVARSRTPLPSCPDSRPDEAPVAVSSARGAQ